MVCPAKSAYDLHKAWPESELFWIPDAGHSVEVRKYWAPRFVFRFTEVLH